MLPAEVPEFKAQVRTMFAGLGISAHDNPERLAERVEAWTVGLGKMPLSLFVRCMEHLLAAVTWPEYLPKKRADMVPGDLWKIARELRAGRADAPDAGGRNSVRDYWRSVIVHDMAHWLGLNVATFEPVLIARKDTLGRNLLSLLNELEQQDRRDGRTIGQHRYAQRITGDLAYAHRDQRTEHAPPLPAAAPDELFA